MPPKDKDPTSPKSPAKSRAKAKPTAETPATTVAPKKAAAPRSRKRVAAASADAPASASEILSDVSSSREAQIRLRAYLIYAERGHRPGSPESDWFQAEQEVVYGRQA